MRDSIPLGSFGRLKLFRRTTYQSLHIYNVGSKESTTVGLVRRNAGTGPAQSRSLVVRLGQWVLPLALVTARRPF